MRTTLLAALLILVMTMRNANSDLIFEPVTWDIGEEGWTSRDGIGTVANTGSGTLGFSFAGTGSPTMQTDAVIADNLPGFSGNYNAYGGLFLTFNWYGYASSLQSLYFESPAGGGTSWAYDLNVTTDGWNAHTVSLSSQSGWSAFGGGTATFAEALADVNRIGILVNHLNIGDPLLYQLDNWVYGVPEPGSIAMLLMVFGSSYLSLRSRRKQPLEELV